jgi:ribonuclease Y
MIWLLLILVPVGAAAGYYARKTEMHGKAQSADARAEAILKDAHEKEQAILKEAQDKQQTLLLEAKEKALALMVQAEKDLQSEKQSLKDSQKRLEERENRLDERFLDIDKQRAELDGARAKTEEIKKRIEDKMVEGEAKIERIAGLSREAALEVLMTRVEKESQDALMSRLHKMDEASEEELESKARKVLSLVIQRFASSQVVDISTTFVELPTDDMKGRIIGREGRNIKVLEHMTGCEIIVDDTPNTVTVSGFSPIRRQIAKRAIEMLVKDGRIQPARIEECIELAKKELAKEIKKAGEDALYELGIPVSSIDPKLVSILGRLKFRTSYGQNVLQHSIEVARISGMIADELGADVFACKKGGLFHDIGKAVDHDMQGAHPEIGYNIMKKFGWPEDLCYQSIAHHEDKPRTLEGVIVKAADAISGARPGARRNSAEEYVQRLQALEDTAMGFPGVEKAYAIQAGREVRVFVRPQEINDYDAVKMANQLAKKIENDLTYPGEVRVTIIRETRVTEYAR